MKFVKSLIFITVASAIFTVLEGLLMDTWVIQNGDRFGLGIAFGVVIALGINYIND